MEVIEMNILNIIIEYLISYALVFLLYYFLFIRKKTKYNKNKIPVEYYFLVNVYKINSKDINYKKFIYLSGFVNTFIIVTTYIIVSKLISKWFLQLLFGVVIIVLLIIICYGIIGRYYKGKEHKEKRK